ncbi:energy-coupling factor transporter transmembrane protein EcfT [Mycetocola tolaasinivorans]|uniref:Energy-coupling factor transporter transmembrane protein EcfT n=1 Tax=Mycetocola tolaasinivorans TaxID=76635 RepID=A0A3L7A8H4_9MICO|nr:energy-coupling factor transporter transmembrane protein EcfT [Mycetocola tolaasinivorans]RLP76120.1 energy-coupling factor transporter transmembrane protein EcfT [Mycetocola tolaasinivorans]
MISLYRPGNSPLHRLPAGRKLLLIGALILAISIYPHTLWTLGASAAIVVAAFLIAGQGLRGLWRQTRVVLPLIVFTAVFQLIFLPWMSATITTVRILLVILLAALISLTTQTSAMLDAIERALTPLSRIGVRADRIALLLALTITVIPVIISFARDIITAHRARGVRPGPRTFVVPLLVQTMRFADELGEALNARGVRS